MGANKAEDANEHSAGKLPGRIATGSVGRRWRLGRRGHTASTTPRTGLDFVEKAHLPEISDAGGERRNGREVKDRALGDMKDAN